MATFTYVALDESGQEVRGEVEAVTNEEAIDKIRKLNQFPTQVREKSAGKLKAGAPGVSVKKKSLARPRSSAYPGAANNLLHSCTH